MHYLWPGTPGPSAMLHTLLGALFAPVLETDWMASELPFSQNSGGLCPNVRSYLFPYFA